MYELICYISAEYKGYLDLKQILNLSSLGTTEY